MTTLEGFNISGDCLAEKIPKCDNNYIWRAKLKCSQPEIKKC